MAGGEIYTALERGVIDATEWVAPFHDVRLGLDRAARFYYYPGWHEPGSTLELMINIDKWNALPPDLQKIVEIAATGTNVRMYAQMEFHNQQALRMLQKNKNVQILKFPEEVLAALRRLSKEALEEEAAANPNFKHVYEAYNAFRKNHDIWDKVSEQAYLDSLRIE